MGLRTSATAGRSERPGSPDWRALNRGRSRRVEI